MGDVQLHKEYLDWLDVRRKQITNMITRSTYAENPEAGVSEDFPKTEDLETLASTGYSSQTADVFASCQMQIATLEAARRSYVSAKKKRGDVFVAGSAFADHAQSAQDRMNQAMIFLVKQGLAQ